MEFIMVDLNIQSSRTLLHPNKFIGQLGAIIYIDTIKRNINS